MTVLVFGRNGQVAEELRRFDGVTAVGRSEVDLMRPGAAQNAISSLLPSAVINAAAYTAVDAAENNEAAAQRLNAETPNEMALTCADLDIPLVHISTDYVFDGSGDKPWSPDDPTSPINAYGRSKLAGENAVRNSGGRNVVLRTSWVFSAHGNNFVQTMLRLSETRNVLNVVSDQVGGPTPARAIATACLSIADQLLSDPSKSGTYHFSGEPDVSWHGFATQIFFSAGRKVAVHPISTSAYPTPATRPLNCRLECRSTETIFSLSRPDWRSGLLDILTQMEMVR